MKTNKLEGADLDHWVARSLGIISDGPPYYKADHDNNRPWSPSTSWTQGGPLVERERIMLKPGQDEWVADWIRHDRVAVGIGPTPLIAAMRCFVASKFGEEVQDWPTKTTP